MTKTNIKLKRVHEALAERGAGGGSLEKLTGLLPSPMIQLHGSKAPPFVLPDNIVCFSRNCAVDLNRPYRGRALHHRFVLILALETGATVRVDYREVKVGGNNGVIVFPFQFHDYTEPAGEKLKWLFVTFELPNDGALAPLRYRPFAITPEIRGAAAELVAAYLSGDNSPQRNLLVALRLAVLLMCIRMAGADAQAGEEPASFEAGLATRVNQLAEERTRMPSTKEIAEALGISSSYLQARFRESCGVSLGRHLRRLRLEKARGLLRMSTQRVSDVATACGFSSVFIFSRAFRTLYGVSPREYRKGGDVRVK